MKMYIMMLNLTEFLAIMALLPPTTYRLLGGPHHFEQPDDTYRLLLY